MIGTTLKVGYDGSRVTRGLGGLRGKLGRLGRQVGIGMARQVGARSMDMLGRMIRAVPDAIKETSDWASNLTDMATQTKLSVKELILLEEKLRLSGATARDSSKMISTMVDALHEASIEVGPARDALFALGMDPGQFKNKTPAEAFDMIGNRVSALGPEFAGLETAMADLFGAKMGYGLLRFFNDIEANTKRAEHNVGKLASAMDDKLAVKMDTFADSLGRWQTIKRSFSSVVLDELFKSMGDEVGNDIFDFIDPEKIRPQIAEVTKSIRDLFADLASGKTTILGELEKLARWMGKAFAEGIKESFGLDGKGIGGILGSVTGIGNITKGLDIKPKEWLKSINPFDKSSGQNKALEKQMKRATNILEKIHTKQGVAIAI